jgi:hypothetical protein
MWGVTAVGGKDNSNKFSPNKGGYPLFYTGYPQEMVGVEEMLLPRYGGIGKSVTGFFGLPGIK